MGGSGVSVGIGIVGCGLIADFHARAIADLRGTRLVGGYSRRPKASAAFAKRFGCEVFDSLAELLAEPRVNVVAICTPSGAHAEPAIAAARAGKHVIVEKPLEVTLPRCDSIIEACRKSGVVLSTIFPSRFHRSSQLMKDAVAAGRFGRLALGSAYVKWFRTQEYYDSKDWRGTKKLDGGGALMNQAIHTVDLLLWMMGRIVEVSAATATLAHQRIDVEDCAAATLRFANGALGSIEATTASYPGWLKRIEICGSTGSAALEEENLVRWQFSKSTTADRRILAAMTDRTKTGGGASDPAAIGHHGHREQYRDVLRAIRTGGSPLIDGPAARQSVELILAIYRSARTGRRVHLTH
jgi:predicted dehydrogenase